VVWSGWDGGEKKDPGRVLRDKADGEGEERKKREGGREREVSLESGRDIKSRREG